MKLILSNIFAPLAFVGLYSYLGSAVANIMFLIRSIGEIPNSFGEPFFAAFFAVVVVLPLALFMIVTHLVTVTAFFRTVVYIAS